jgi:3-hydroxy-3-methylglutaryl CoA synthase
MLMRWKLFLPLAVILTLLGMLGSNYWSASASHRQIAALQQESVANISENEDSIVLSLEANGDLADILANLDQEKVNRVLAGRELKLQRTGLVPIDLDFSRQVDLLVAQAVATREYYSASLMLEKMAQEHGYNSALVIWGDRVVAEVGDSLECHIAQQVMEVRP